MSTNPNADAVSGTQSGYDRWAAVYDSDGNPLQAMEGPRVRELAGDVAGLRVLDMGCGTGRHALWLAEAGARVKAVDFSEGMLDQARQKPGADAVEWIVHDLHTPLPFAAGTFDLVVSGLVLEHIRDLRFFFSEARRVLCEGGRVVVSSMHPAMMLRGAQARFTDPESGEVVQPGSLPHQISDFVMAGLDAGLRLDHLGEYQPDAALAARFPRAERYIGWPMLVMMRWAV